MVRVSASPKVLLPQNVRQVTGWDWPGVLLCTSKPTSTTSQQPTSTRLIDSTEATRMAKCESQQQPQCDFRHFKKLLDNQVLPIARQTVPRKRKPSTDLASPRPHPRPSPQPSSAAPNKPQSTSLATPNTLFPMAPEPGSINAILREHCRARLYVRPVAWTVEQPRLLGCRFILRKLPSGPKKPSIPGEHTNRGRVTLQDAAELHQERIRQARFLQQHGVTQGRYAPLSYLLETFNVHFTE